MVEIESNLNDAGILYIPKEIRSAFGGPKVKIVLDAIAALFFPSTSDYEDVIESLDVIRKDLEHRKRLREKALRK